jgi:hypothetical protein
MDWTIPASIAMKTPTVNAAMSPYHQLGFPLAPLPFPYTPPALKLRSAAGVRGRQILYQAYCYRVQVPRRKRS